MQATSEEYTFHQRICARNDPIAFAELAERLYVLLVQDVRRRAGTQADPMLVEEAVGQALLDYHDMPERYDPSRKSLQGYLVMAAYRDFQNAQAKEYRVMERQVSLFDPAFQECDIVEETTDSVDGQLDTQELWKLVDEAFPDAVERRIVTLIVNRVRSPEPYAQVLGCADLPYEERIRRVRLVRNRIARRLRRRMTQRLHYRGGRVQ
jgi:hypothetical protein